MKKLQKTNKLYILGVSAMSALAIAAPIVMVSSCGNEGKNKAENKAGGNKKSGSKTSKTTGTSGNEKTIVEAKKTNGVFSIPKMATPTSDDYGTKNYKSKAATLSNSLNKTEYDTRKSTGSVFAPHLHPRDIGTWDAKKTTDGEYIRSKVPLQKRVISSESSKINTTKKDGRVYFMDSMRANTSNSIVGTAVKNSVSQQILGAMQYATDWIAFGGSTGEGTIYIPRAQDIDQLHRSGVRVHGTIFMAPGAFGGSPKAYSELLSAGPKVAAEKLVEIAKYYGFDGWMFNDENNINSKDLPGWKEMLLELHKLANKEKIEVSYYSNTQRKSGQEVAKLGKKAVDVWFNDYGWGGDTWGTKNGTNKPANSSDFLDEKHSPRGVQATNGVSRGIKNSSGNSMWFYTAVKDGQAFISESSRMTLMNGATIKDTRDATESGLAHWYKEYTTLVDRKEFATSFNRGDGTNFNINGKKVDSKVLKNGYSNLALSDLQPTWRYIQDKVTSGKSIKDSSLNIKQETDSKDAWFGSSVLSYKGTVAANSVNINKLFASQLEIEGKDKVEIMFKGAIAPKFVGWTNNGADKEIIDGAISPDKFSNGYKKVTFDLTKLASKTMTSFGVAFGTGVVDTKIGQLRYIPDGVKQKDKVTVDKVIGEGQWFTSTGKNVRIRVETKDVSKMYMVYATIKGKKELIKITNSPAMVIKGIGFDQSLTKLEIIPYDDSLNGKKPIIINLNTSTLKLEDDKKWSHRVVKKPGEFGVETMHGIVTSISDNEDGAYLFDDGITVMHYKKSGELDRKGNFGKKLFPGKNNTNGGRDGESLAGAFVTENKLLFVSRKATVNSSSNQTFGENGLYVFDENMNPKIEFKKLQKHNAIYGKDDEYVDKMFESRGYVYLISNKGTIKRVSAAGVLDKTYSKSVALTKSHAGVQVTVLKNKDGSFELISQADDRDFLTVTRGQGFVLETKTFSMTDDGGVSANANFEKIIGANAETILKTRELKDSIVIVDRIGRVFDYNKTTKTIALRTTIKFGNREEIKTENVFKAPDKNHTMAEADANLQKLLKKYGKITKFSQIPLNTPLPGKMMRQNGKIWTRENVKHTIRLNLDTVKFDVTISTDGNTILTRDTTRTSRLQPWNNGYVEEFSWMNVFDVSKGSTDTGHSYYIKKSSTTDINGNYKKWGGHIRTMVMLSDGRILYGTDDFGRIGLINFDKTTKDDKEKLKLQEVGEVTFMFEKDGKKLPIKKVLTLTGEDKNVEINPTK